MSDLIDRDKTLESVTDAISAYIPFLEGDAIKIPLDVARVIMNMPSAEPEIIRCKDCKHYYYADNRMPQEQRYSCALDGDRWNPDSFCSFAERRQDGQ